MTHLLSPSGEGALRGARVLLEDELMVAPTRSHRNVRDGIARRPGGARRRGPRPAPPAEPKLRLRRVVERALVDRAAVGALAVGHADRHGAGAAAAVGVGRGE